MNKLLLITAGALTLISTITLANTGLEKSIDTQVNRANEEIVVIESFKNCVKKSNDGADIKACHQSKKVEMKQLWAARAKK
ncbi:hypothetical protein [Colwellia piezophila]|uniref:hypothetical protein n=1 Tax=Colwellia piezophila TaxID=211668 RepID=UPI00038188FE|nr:hypothetical protein [Colwellia piezophila]